MTFVSSTRRRGLFRRKLVDRIVRILSVAALAVAVAGMIWILWTVVSRGAAVISLEFSRNPPNRSARRTPASPTLCSARWRSPSAPR